MSKVTLTFNKVLLDKICIRDSCKVKLTHQQYNDLTRDKRITFICGSKDCNNNGDKTFRMMYHSGGFCNACQSKIAKEKRKITNRVLFGKDNAAQNATIQQKMKNTNQIRHGFDNAAQNEKVKQKMKETNIIRYGKENPAQNEEVKQKMKDTNNIKYGEDYPRQNAEVAAKASKNAYKVKPFTFPCGNIIQVQGYEHFALELLIKKGYTFVDITTDMRNVPEIRYITEDNKKHRYFCDILLHNEDKIIEVKSAWTYDKGKDKIQLKAQACIDEGFEYEIWIFDDKKNLQVITYDKPDVTFTEMLLAM